MFEPDNEYKDKRDGDKLEPMEIFILGLVVGALAMLVIRI